jgi:hypothetical protein
LVTVILLVIIGLTLEGIINPYIGIVLGVITFLVPIIITALLTTYIENALSPKASLRIENLEFTRRFQNIDGYQIKAAVTNKGKKICYKLDATFQIKDDKGKSPNLLFVSIDKVDEHETVTSREEPMRAIGYAWIDEGKETTSSSLEKLRKDDCTELVFPYETTSIGVGKIGGSMSLFSSECLLKLTNSVNYDVTVTVKGEDSDKNTVVKSKKATLRC